MLASQFSELSAQSHRGDKIEQFTIGMHLLSKNDHHSRFTGRNYIKQAAEQGHAEACFEHAKLLMEENNLSLAGSFFFKAASAGNEEAKRQFHPSGIFYQKAIQILENRSAAYHIHAYHIGGGKDDLAYWLGKAYSKHDFGCQDNNQALKFYNLAISMNPNHILALNALADVYYFGQLDQPIDFKKAYDFLIKVDHLTDVRRDEYGIKAGICYRLGGLQEEGKGTAKSIDAAIASYRKAVSHKHLEATYRLAVIYYQQFESSLKQIHPHFPRAYYFHTNVNEAIRLFEQCGVNKQAYHYLGLIYHRQKNLQKAEYYFDLAAKMDLPVAARNLGIIYSGGEFGEAKKISAVRWYEKAAMLGHIESQYTFSTYLEKGEFIEKDLIKAFEWCLKAAEGKHLPAQEKLENDPLFSHYNALYSLADNNLEKLQQYLHLEEALAYKFVEPKHLYHVFDRRKDILGRDAPFRKYEFMGDSLLGVTCTTLLFAGQPKDWRVQDFNLAREALVSNKGVLLKVAKNLNLAGLILLDSAEALQGITDGILADTAEALIGAIYFDKNMEIAMQVIEKLWGNDLNQLLLTKPSESVTNASSSSSSGNMPVSKSFFKPELSPDSAQLLRSFEDSSTAFSSSRK